MREAIEFHKWCDEPIFDANGNYICRRVNSQAPDYDSYLVKDENNQYVWPKGIFPSIEEVYEYWFENHCDLFSEKNNVMKKETCAWRQVNVGFYGCPDYVYQTLCGKEYDVDKQEKGNFCLHCGKKIL